MCPATFHSGDLARAMQVAFASSADPAPRNRVSQASELVRCQRHSRPVCGQGGPGTWPLRPGWWARSGEKAQGGTGQLGRGAVSGQVRGVWGGSTAGVFTPPAGCVGGVGAAADPLPHRVEQEAGGGQASPVLHVRGAVSMGTPPHYLRAQICPPEGSWVATGLSSNRDWRRGDGGRALGSCPKGLH